MSRTFRHRKPRPNHGARYYIQQEQERKERKDLRQKLRPAKLPAEEQK